MRKTLFSSLKNSLFRSIGSKKTLTSKFLISTTATFMGVSLTQQQFSLKAQENEQKVVYEVSIDADFAEGEMRDVQVGPAKDDVVLVCKVDGQYYCVQSKCSHFGAPLSSGVLFNDKVMCPWHNAAFSVKTGYAEQGPVFDGLAKFEIQQDGNQLHIKVPKDLLNKKHTVPMTNQGSDPRRFVIVGAGPAGLSCAETLRQAGFEGEIILYSKEEVLPYDRTLLSKWFTGNAPEKVAIRNQEFYDKYDIKLVRNTQVSNIDFDKKVLETQDGNRVNFERILLATGGEARRPTFEGCNLENVATLRNTNDMQQIQKIMQNSKKVVVIGGSFIGCETASSIKKELKDNVDVTVVDVTNSIFERVLGSQVGNALQKWHESNGVKFLLQKNVKSIDGLNGQVTGVTFTDGTKVQADAVVIGVGMIPNVGLMASQLKLSPENGGVETNPFLETSKEGVYAAGDCASVPYWYTGEKVRIEHYNEAIKQGSVAAFNMLGRKQVYNDIAFFWTRHFDKSLQYSGYASSFDDVHIDGNVDELKFVAYYSKNNKILAASSMNVPSSMQIINEAMRLNLMPTASEIKNGSVTLKDIQNKIVAAGSRSSCGKAGCCKNKN